MVRGAKRTEVAEQWAKQMTLSFASILDSGSSDVPFCGCGPRRIEIWAPATDPTLLVQMMRTHHPKQLQLRGNRLCSATIPTKQTWVQPSTGRLVPTHARPWRMPLPELPRQPRTKRLCNHRRTNSVASEQRCEGQNFWRRAHMIGQENKKHADQPLVCKLLVRLQNQRRQMLLENLDHRPLCP